MRLLEQLNIRLVNLTAGSPYYNPHIQRPALFTRSRMVTNRRKIRCSACEADGNDSRPEERNFPNLLFVGSAYCYLQDFLPTSRRLPFEMDGRTVGLGRMVLTYPELLWDALQGRPSSTRDLSHLQRLHDGTPQRYAIWLLSTGCLLQDLRVCRENWLTLQEELIRL